METADERKFARMSLLDRGGEDSSSANTHLHPDDLPLSPRTLPKQRTGSPQQQQSQHLIPRKSLSQRSHGRTNSLREEAFGPDDGTTSLRSYHSSGQNSPRASSEIPTSTTGDRATTTATGSVAGGGMASVAPSTYNGDAARRRGSSLSSRFPGDQSHRPLDIIRRESVKANRAPHLHKKAHHGADVIDKLAAGSLGDDDLLTWHHEGPYDAASLARNQRWQNSPLQAISRTNRETLRSVHRNKVLDSIERHRPLDGFAFVPPGIRDTHGNIFYYEEGTDMMRHNGADYRRWPGIDYHPDDLKGKGEPSFTIERQLKAHERAQRSREHRRIASEGGPGIGLSSGSSNNGSLGIELSSRPARTRSLHVAGSGNEPSYSEWQADLQRSQSGSAGGLRKRFGSLRKRAPPAEISAEDILSPTEERVLGKGQVGVSVQGEDKEA